MKKSVVILSSIIALICFLPSNTFSYYEDKLYCKVTKDSILISLNSKDGLLCNAHIRSLELAMKTAYIDMLALQKHIDQKDDVEYRTELKQDKSIYLNSLQSVRLDILAHMKSFEYELLQKSKNFFLKSIAPYQKKLRSVLRQVGVTKDKKGMAYINLVKEQLSTIDFLSQSETFEVFAVNLQKYIYLKKQLAGK